MNLAKIFCKYILSAPLSSHAAKVLDLLRGCAPQALFQANANRPLNQTAPATLDSTSCTRSTHSSARP